MGSYRLPFQRLPKSAKNFGVTELELTGLLVNIHGFMQLLCNRYFEVLVDHKAIEYMIKSKTESPTTRLKTFKFFTTFHTTLHRTLIFSFS